MLNCHIYGKKPSVIQYLNQIKQDWYHANNYQDEDANKRDLAWIFFKIEPNIAHSLRSHPINVEGNRINSDEYNIVLSSFLAAILETTLSLEYLQKYYTINMY